MNKGFTLIELVVSAGIMAVLSVTLVSVLANTYQASNRIAAVAEIEGQGTWVIGQLKQLVPLTESDSLSCVQGVSSTTYIMKNVLDGIESNIICTGDDLNEIASKAADMKVSWINNLSVKCDKFATCEGESGGRVNAVKFTFTLSKQAVGQTVSREFNTRILLRN